MVNISLGFLGVDNSLKYKSTKKENQKGTYSKQSEN
jgi:hypothetical protein